jgi:hypothetical protein
MTDKSDDELSIYVERELPDPELLRRFTNFESLSIDELRKLSDQLFSSAEYVAKNIDAMLGEPPDSMHIRLPRLLFRVLEDLRRCIESCTNLSDEDIALDDEVRERMAICVCVGNPLHREDRLIKALVLLSDAKRPDVVPRLITQKLIVAIVLRLVGDFKFAEDEKFDILNGFACQALRFIVARTSVPDERFGLFCDFCQLTLLDLNRKILTSEDAEQSKSTWERSFSDAATLFEPKERAGSDSNDTQFEWMVHEVLKLTAISRDTSAVQQAVRFGRAAFKFEENRAIACKLTAQLFDAMLMVARTRANCGWPVPEALQALLPVLRVRHRFQLAEEHRRRRKGWDSAVFKEELAGTEIDETVLRRHVQRLLEETGNGRRGLALSGGGFRATCFHLGVLAHLAESNQLDCVDTISCVSGGAIAGAAYAVRLKTLLAQKFDINICQGDYVEVVMDVINAVTNFAGTNLRMRALASPKAVLKMWLYPGYTYAERIAELLDKALFLPLARKHPSFAGVSEEQLLRQINRSESMTKPDSKGRAAAIVKNAPIGWPLAPWDLRVAPRGEPLDFNADRKHNAPRNAKCPQTVFNTTSIKSGASFVFSPEAHGERPPRYAGEISSRPRIPWTSYEHISALARFAPEHLKLSRIVAASAGVPGLIPRPCCVVRKSMRCTHSLTVVSLTIRDCII